MWSISQPKWSFREHLHHVMRLLEIAKVLRSLQKNLSQPCGSEIPVLAPLPLPGYLRNGTSLSVSSDCCSSLQTTHTPGSALRPIRAEEQYNFQDVHLVLAPETRSGHTSLSVTVQSKSRWPRMPRNPGVTPWGAPSKSRHSPGLVHFRMAVWMSPEPPACKKKHSECC